MEAMVPGDEVRFLPCLHHYHTQCVDAWILKSMSCPECNIHLGFPS
jgi:E3 ubiquitin-protein ligase RNF11